MGLAKSKEKILKIDLKKGKKTILKEKDWLTTLFGEKNKKDQVKNDGVPMKEWGAKG